MTWTSILLYVGAAAAGWALKHYYPALLGGAATPTPAVPPATTPAAPAPAPIAVPAVPSATPLADLLFQLVTGLVTAKSTSGQLPPVEAQLASIVHGLLTPLVPAPTPALPK